MGGREGSSGLAAILGPCRAMCDPDCSSDVPREQGKETGPLPLSPPRKLKVQRSQLPKATY